MKFITSSTQLLQQLQVLNGVISSSNTVPILDSILFEIRDNRLTLSASDLETTLTASLEIETTDRGSLAIPARLLTDLLKTFAEQPLTFLVKAESKTVEIASDKGTYSIAYKDGSEFPKALSIEDPASLQLPARVLGHAMGKTLFATGSDDLRPTMTGVLFQMDESGCTFVATDAHKLVKYRRTDIQSERNVAFIMPKKPLSILKGILTQAENDLSITYNDVNARFSFENIALTSRLIDGKYPDYEKVIPKENPNKLVIDRMAFLTSVRRVSYFSSKTTYQIRLKLTGNALQILAEDIDFSNKAEERLSCDYQGDDLEIGFNARFLSEMMGALDVQDIAMRLSKPNKAGVISPLNGTEEGEEISMLIMPVMLNA